ncbi:hypothetical protein FSP39_013082 [Pinctada imbricata]|uniref:Solute carrier family 23 member 2 n=1 Tax=Pinctada imbricata TaxID=66713 RepID=A0AA88XM58_PINIB|nr:hypothetical protein FSP39_013082 [Pinctada imbricata]
MTEMTEVDNGEINAGFHEEQEKRKTSVVLPAITVRKVSYDPEIPENGSSTKFRNTEARIRRSSGIPEIQIEHDEEDDPSKLLYKISETPKFHLLLLFGLQQALLSLATSLLFAIMGAQVVCAEDDAELKAQLLGSILFVNGLSTLIMVTVGSRLPLYQGAYGSYLIPLLTLAAIQPDRCNIHVASFNTTGNLSQTVTEEAMKILKKELATGKLQELHGGLMIVGVIHALIGATGLIGLLLRFIGPVTIVPTILLLGVYFAEPVLGFAARSWPITLFTAAVAFILAFYLAKVLMPIPVWTPKKGCRIIRYPLHQVYAILIAIVISWIVSLIVTEAGGFTDNPKDKGYLARTDATINQALDSSDWFFFPYPGFHGAPKYDTAVLVAFLIATFISILDSIGDYYACAAMSHVPPPPTHAVNRGIFAEGICTILSGVFGSPVGTTTYGPNIGAIGVTRVASRSVFIALAVIYMVLSVLGKLSAIFISIPYPVLGGALIVMAGMFNGVTLSNLQPVDLSSSRNLAVMGTALMVGLVVPLWVKTYPEDIDTGNIDVDFILKGLLGNPNFSGSVIACFLDNTIPGTKKERGIAAWQNTEHSETKASEYEEGPEVYEIPLPARVKSWSGWKYVPFMPDPEVPDRNRSQSLSSDWSRRKSYQISVPNGMI